MSSPSSPGSLPQAPRTASPVPWLTSVYSGSDRGPYGDPRYPGNCSGRLVKDLLKYFRARQVLDPMAGGGTCRDVCMELGIDCQNLDVHQGFDASDPRNFQKLGPFDFVFLHPPYWRMKQYSDDPRDLANAPHLNTFLRRLQRVIRNCRSVLSPQGKLAILMGNYTDRGRFLPLTYFTMDLCLKEGLWPACTDIIKFQHNASSSHKQYRSSFIPNLHEVCLILKPVQTPGISKGFGIL